ncbi:MAG: type II/IV secretion system protein [Nitrospirae bacterium]|nr:MAG: type II/IV secretion system protein [Nitrospirota bacterium]
MNEIVVDIESISGDVLELYRRFPDRSDFIPVSSTDKEVQFLVSSQDGARKANLLALKAGRLAHLRFVPSEELLETAEQMSQLFSEEVEFSAEEGGALREGYDILSGAGEDAPVVKLVNQIIMDAIRSGASDIHIEGRQKGLTVRYRIDGRLKTVKSLDRGLLDYIVARIKVMANMDVAETRRPQDGRINIQFGTKTIDIRVSTIPSATGEKVVLRLLQRSEEVLSLNNLGIDERRLNLFKRLLRSPNGIIMVTGPTGSGKTTTLYASINEIKDEAINIVTIEDPIEYRIDGIVQVQVNQATGVTFARSIRTFLRQDPDVILVGEIRDEETAEAAIQASLTGHLVLTTLHTSDAPTAVARLIDMNIEPFLIASSLLLVIGQRLVRKICPYCKKRHQMSEEMTYLFQQRGIQIDHYWKGSGCEECLGTGYRGRTGIFEFLQIDDDIRKLIMRKANSSQIKTMAIRKHMKTMFEDGIELVKGGVTTPEEVLTVTTQGYNGTL